MKYFFRLTIQPYSAFQAGIALWMVATIIIFQQYIDHVATGFELEFSWFLVLTRRYSEYGSFFILIPLLSFPLNYFSEVKTDKIISIFKIVTFLFLLAAIHRFISIVIFDIIYGLKNQLPVHIFRPQNISGFSAGLISSGVQWIIIGSVTQGIMYYQKYIEKEKALANAELLALKMQLNPHFLFNTFNSIISLIDIAPEKAQEMLTKLSNLFRKMLQQERELFTTLELEMSFIKEYLDIELIRFQDILTVEYDIEPTTLDIKIPTFLIQPLVENAFKHGISQTKEDAKLSIGAKIIDQDNLMIWVSDNGLGPSKNTNGFGIGLHNIQERLKQIYGDDFKVRITKGNGFRVEIELPIRDKI